MLDSKVDSLGECTITNPAGYENYVSKDAVVLYQVLFKNKKEVDDYYKNGPLFFEQAGPLEKIYFDPAWNSAGIVTCGGLCPGINDVIRAIVMELYYRYKIKRVIGFQYGFAGLIKKNGYEPVNLTPNVVAEIHTSGGSFLSSSRGPQDYKEMVQSLIEQGIKILFCIGGDGTLKGAQALYEEIKRRGEKISIIGIPKTIDNDINMIHKTFGFSTAFSKAVEAVSCAHAEAKGAPNGIGLVKLMGRHSGFITVNAALASRDVNFVLIPEEDFDLEGEGAFLPTLKQRMLARGHAVILIAEGAGQKYFKKGKGKDASGNIKLGDIGVFLKEEINRYFTKEGISINLKYIDPSYIIRSVPANEEDSVFCGFLAQNAVHAGLAGKTGMVVGFWNNVFINLPIHLATSERKVLVPKQSTLWRSVLAATGQPNSMKARN
ncbi:ATP-dependent 6-phosphofructokinase [Deltaproteobacteria bacterium TL4]